MYNRSHKYYCREELLSLHKRQSRRFTRLPKKWYKPVPDLKKIWYGGRKIVYRVQDNRYRKYRRIVWKRKIV